MPFDGNTILWILTTYDVDQKSSSTSDASAGSTKCKNKGRNANTLNLTVSDERNFIDNYSTYPNPVNDFANVAYLEGEISEQNIMIFDSQGKMRKTKVTHDKYAKVIELDMAAFEPGVYLIKLQNGDKMSILRVIKR